MTVRRRAAVPLLLALGCAPPAQQRYEEALADTGPSAEHAVHAERLAVRMRGLERLTEERLPQALDVEAARESRLESVREVALAVADSAQGIADAVDELEPRLDPAARAQFVALADALGARARDLASDVRGLSGATLEERFDELHTVCDRCHAQFRLPR